MVSSAIGSASSPNWVSRHRSRMPQEIPTAKNFSSSKRRNGKEPKEEDEEEEEEEVETVEMEKESKYSSRVCLGCKSSKTPLWRSGPKGPKTLCNACGIKYSKRRKRRAGTETSPIPPPRRSMMGCRNSKALEEELKQRQREKQKRMLVMLMESKRSRKAAMEEAKCEDGREVANAALLLMSLSSGFCVYA